MLTELVNLIQAINYQNYQTAFCTAPYSQKSGNVYFKITYAVDRRVSQTIWWGLKTKILR